MAITGIQSLVYGVEDLAISVQFHKDFGLTLLSEDQNGADFEVTDGSTIKIRSLDDAALPADVLSKPGVRELIWRVDSAAALDALAENLSADREVTKDADGILHTKDAYDIPIGFQVFEARAIIFEQVPVNTPTDVQRWNANRKWYDAAAPALIHHVGYAVPDVDLLADFYVERLGFRVTDMSKGLAIFLLADGRQDHHNIFVARSERFGGGLLWNHVSYGVENVDELMTGANHMQRQGYTSHNGMGRHRISSAINYYINNPAGGDSEYLTDTDYVDETWKPRLWNPAFGFYHWTAELCDVNRTPAPEDCVIIEGAVPKLADVSGG
jgi:hypothetical protein